MSADSVNTAHIADRVDNFLKKHVPKEKTRRSLKDYLELHFPEPAIQLYVLYETFSKYKTDSPLQLLKKKEFLFDHSSFDSIREAIHEQEHFIKDPIQVEDGVISCRKCKSHKTYSYSKQTRASDEGMSVFVTCIQCHYKFKL